MNILQRQDAGTRYGERTFVLLSTDAGEAQENATEGHPDGIYRHGRVAYARPSAWHSAKV